MNIYLLNSLITIFSFLAMEFVAWVAHKYIMHGLLWFLHEDHHVVNSKKLSFFERNDFFFLIFAIPGILCLFFGMRNYNYLFWIGLGITLYGFAYFLVHEIFIHQRIRYFRNSNNFYLRAIRKAHKIHHKHLVKENGECFGMLLVPFKYFKEAKNNK